MSEELIRKLEVLKLLDDLGGCGAQDEFARGWDKAIGEAYSRVDDMQPVNAVELPCKVDDIVYVVANCSCILTDFDSETGFSECPFEDDCNFEDCVDNSERIFETIVESICIDTHNKEWYMTVKKVFNQIFLSDFNKVVFLSREEAERALEGLKNEQIC